MMKKLRLILGDQLNSQHDWYTTQDDEVVYVLMEMRQETDYVRHHIQKIIAFFAAMRNFAAWLRTQGHRVEYIHINDTENTQVLSGNLNLLIQRHNIEQFEYQMPDEHRLDEELKNFCRTLNIPSQVFDTQHFFTTRTELGDFFKGKKTYIMESFYRAMRKKHHVLMQGAEPEGSQWNYDASNRKPFKGDASKVPVLLFQHNYSDLFETIEQAGIEYFGEANAQAFIWPTTRNESLEALQFFLDHLFQDFGNYQDAMLKENWTLYHARISFALNSKMISPKEVVEGAIGQWRKYPECISIEQCEGFVRQILGWREYMRGIYWAKMPDYALLNYFDHQRPLPAWFWTGETKMNCLHHAIKQSLQYAYAHHIQRLMVTGNFALLAGINPDELDMWYLGIYIDAIEWVEITNTRGMSQFADGGIVGTKPYVSSANYIDKMSNYCKGCYYDKSKKTGERACPFNSLYWHFHERHRDLLEKNPRIGMVYQVLKKMEPENKEALLAQAESYLAQMETL